MREKIKNFLLLIFAFTIGIPCTIIFFGIYFVIGITAAMINKIFTLFDN